MPTVPSRPTQEHVRIVGRTEKVLGWIILLLLAAIVSAFVARVLTNEDHLFNVDAAAYQDQPETNVQVTTAPARLDASQTENPFPEPGVPGWQRPTHVGRYATDNLHIKINGRAEAYLKFQVVGLTFGTYTHRDDPGRTVDVYVYDMGEPARASGMYRSELPPDVEAVPIGDDAYQSGGAVFFRKGASYVQVLPTGQGAADAQAALRIAERLAAGASASGS